MAKFPRCITVVGGAGFLGTHIVGYLRRRHPAAEVRVAAQEELVRALAEARPGTTILIAPGKYRGGLSARLVGTKDDPIVVAGADANDPPVIEGGGGGLHLRSPAHVELRDLVVAGASGNGINIDDGGTYMAWYLPLVLLTIFRPNLEDRVALTVLAEGWLPRRLAALPSGKAA